MKHSVLSGFFQRFWLGTVSVLLGLAVVSGTQAELESLSEEEWQQVVETQGAKPVGTAVLPNVQDSGAEVAIEAIERERHYRRDIQAFKLEQAAPVNDAGEQFERVQSIIEHTIGVRVPPAQP
ncbi:hypothetical protein GP5015_19 [gamma proteobacterium HTCC5015]|nr:hypothetical protein GP5015_19 [gamma proteobacterium HTCC5015]